MERLVFEDRGVSLLFGNLDCTPVSSLLLKGMSGSCMSFSCGAPNFFKELEKCVSVFPDSVIVGFFDVPPGNSVAAMEYNSFNARLKRIVQFRNQVIVIPVICTEYIALKYIDGLGLLRLGGDILRLYNELNAGILTTYTKRGYFSLEKAYKDILGNTLSCFINNKSHGAYYYNDCPCNEKCKVEYPCIKVEDKSELLMSNFPCLNVVSAEHLKRLEELGLTVCDVDPISVRRREIDFINNLSFKLFGVAEINII